MKKYSSTILASFLSIVTANFVVNQPAKASVVCEMDTISYHNNNLEKCILGQNVNIKLAGIQGKQYKVPCQAKSYIIFNKKGKFFSCQLAQDIRVQKSDCPANSNIFVAVGKKGDPSIRCWYF
ncbi:MAG: hypothetical protein QNJ36_10560 [Calothrix sp. MO_167.B42]|nr:hypothetical protein [Calothrix sp. MO_167.B42]